MHAIVVALLFAGARASPVANTARSLLSAVIPAIGHDPTQVTPTGLPIVQLKPVDASILLQNFTSVPLHQGTLSQAELDTRGINQPDPRYSYSNPNLYPWRAVGRVNWGGSNVDCTGALIGKSLVLTAKHCIPNNGGQFCPSYENGPNPTFGCANFQAAYFVNLASGASQDCTIKEDWAVLTIDRDFGTGLGYFGAEIVSWQQWNKAEWERLGYSADLNGAESWRQDNAELRNGDGYFTQVTCDHYGPIWSDDNAAPGDSGSPLWYNGGVVWGVLHGGTNAPNGVFESIFASGDNMVNTIGNLRSQQG